MAISLGRYGVVATALLLVSISSVAADFHLMYSEGKYVGTKYFTCPSNYYKSNCWCDGDRRSSSYQSSGETKFTLDEVCGVAAMDFYYRSGDIWEAYIPNADGHVVATCYGNGRNSVGEDCQLGLPVQNTVRDGWVCYSTICGSA